MIVAGRMILWKPIVNKVAIEGVCCTEYYFASRVNNLPLE